jgi:hypothetical protein
MNDSVIVGGAKMKSGAKMKIRYFDWFKRNILGVTAGPWLCLVTLGFSAYATDYATKFPKTEALISEGGHWITAGTPGVNWHDTMCGFRGDMHVSSVSTTDGYAFGPSSSKRFGDSLALLTGSWGPDQMAEATVRQIKPFGYPEVEIRLRTSPKDATGYEIMWSALGKEKIPYIAIATWDGPGSKPPHYTYLKQLKGPEYGVSTGDVVKGVIIGHTISAYTNGKLQFRITDTTFSTGNPGFGFNEGPAGTYGISSFSATDALPNSTDLGWKPFHPPLAITSVEYRGRPACVRCSRHGGKNTTKNVRTVQFGIPPKEFAAQAASLYKAELAQEASNIRVTNGIADPPRTQTRPATSGGNHSPAYSADQDIRQTIGADRARSIPRRLRVCARSTA